MRVIVLNGVQVSVGEEPAQLQPVQQAALFALVGSLRPLDAEQLRDLLWTPAAQPKDPKRPIKIMSGLRKILDGRLIHGPRGYELKAKRGDLIDLRGWRALINDADSIASDDPRAAAEIYSHAMRHWGDLPTGILPDTTQMHSLVRRLETERLNAVERQAEVQLSLGQHTQVADRLAELAPAWPEREHLAELLMLALHRAQRNVEALTVFEEHRRYLEAKVGVQPHPVLQDLHDQIRSGRSALAKPPPLPPLAPADQAVHDFGGRLDTVSQPRLANYMSEHAFGTYMQTPKPFHNALDRAGIRMILAVVPEVRALEREAVDLAARIARKLALDGITQFIEFGALPPSPMAMHEVVRLPRPTARVLYCNSDRSLVRFSQHVLSDVPDVECTWKTVPTWLRSYQEHPLIDLSQPVLVVNQHELNMTPATREYQEVYAQLGKMLAPGSHLLLTSTTLAGMSPAVPWVMEGVFRTAPAEQLVSRTRADLEDLVPPGFEILEPGVTDTFEVWETWAAQPSQRRDDSPGPLPALSVVAVKR